MGRYEREADIGFPGTTQADAPAEWEYVRTRRRPGAPDGSLPVRLLLIDEGSRMVDERGPGALSVVECARRVGVSKGAPYTWFADAADFRLAVAANLTSILVADLCSSAQPETTGADPIARLAGDAGAIVRNWISNGMGLELVLVRGGPASKIELAWEAERFLHHLSTRVHDAAACACAATFGVCRAQHGLVDAVLAICDGYAALARTARSAPEHAARSAEQAVARLLGDAT